ncbi:MAG: DNA repair protein RadA [Thermodesulfovibrionales bacterium]|nr:DNA repair protein RadA [Thermodesulfovibrionales bacterium]
MSKDKTFYQCQVCGYSTPKWLGRCPDCNTWGSLVEERQTKKISKQSLSQSRLVSLSDISKAEEERKSTGIKEFDRVLGGGIVDGAVVLIGGDPGIGKSTLLLQVLANIVDSSLKRSDHSQIALYVSGEESPEQIKIRAERLSINSSEIVLYSETLIENIINTSQKLHPSIIVIDSIQTVYTEEITSAPGSVSQIRESASKLMQYAKRTATPIFLVGHVTKEGAIAGPRVLEHLVDVVLYFEGDRGHSYRIIRTVKNRFGSTNEIGVFNMTDSGLVEISNPSELFLSERPTDVTGSTVIASIEGTRPLLIEIQALVSPTTFGMPRRTCMGIDFNRLNLLVAILEKRASLQLGNMDIFLNIVGGLKIVEPAADLGIIASLVSSFREVPIDPTTVFFGEVGLTGEVRAVSMAEQRLKEAAKIGFKKAVIPYSNKERLRNDFGLRIDGFRNIEGLVELIKF